MIVWLEVVLTAAGSAAVWFLLGTRIYALVAVVSALLFFSLMITSDARTATSQNPDVVLRPMRWGWWTLLTALISIGMAVFWPMIPIIVGHQKLRNKLAYREYVARQVRDVPTWERKPSARDDAGRVSGTDERP